MSAKKFAINDVPEMKEFAIFIQDAMGPIHVSASNYQFDTEKGTLTLFGEDGKSVVGLFFLNKVSGLADAAFLAGDEFDEMEEEGWE